MALSKACLQAALPSSVCLRDPCAALSEAEDVKVLYQKLMPLYGNA